MELTNRLTDHGPTREDIDFCNERIVDGARATESTKPTEPTAIFIVRECCCDEAKSTESTKPRGLAGVRG